MAAKPSNGDDTDSLANWDACWDALEQLSDSDLPAAALPAEAVRIIAVYRTLTEGRGVERIEQRVRTAFRLTAGQLRTGEDERLNRFIVMLGGALNTFRRGPRRQLDLGGKHPLFSFNSEI